MAMADKSKFTELCWLFISAEWGICKTKLTLLLYYSQAHYLVFSGEALFDYPIYALPEHPGFLGEPAEIIDGTLMGRDWVNFWLGTAYYFVGYLEYFREV